MTWTDDDSAAEARYRLVLELPDTASSAPRLLEALGDESWRVRRLAADRLARLPPTALLVEQLLAVLGRRGEAGARNAAAAALAQLGEAAGPALLRLLSHPDADQRRLAAEILGQARLASAVPALIAALDDADDTVRSAAAEALGRAGGPEARHALVRLLDSKDPLLRVCGLEGLAQLQGPPPLPKLVALLVDPTSRRSAYRLLGLVQHPTALGLVCRGLATQNSRDAALVALGVSNRQLPAEAETDVKSALSRTTDLVPWLTEALEGDDGERRIGALLVAQALGLPALATAVAQASGHGDAAELALRVLVQLGLPGARLLLAGAPPPVLSLNREALAVAGEAILKLSGPALVPDLEVLLDAGDPELSELAARALGRTRAKVAIPPLVRLFDDDVLAVHAWRSLALLAESWPDEVLAALGPRLEGLLQPHAVRAWAHVAGPKALVVVKRAAHDERESVRAAAAESAWAVPEEAASLLGAALMDEAPRVRRAAAFTLSRLPPAAALPLLKRALADSEAAVLAAAADAAGELLAHEVEPRLDELARSTDPSVAMAALKALASAGALSAEALSRALAHADAEVVKQALSLGADRAPVVQAAATLLAHSRWDVRVGAARVLLVSGGPEALPLLEAATAKETDPLAHEVLQAALQALSHR